MVGTRHTRFWDKVVGGGVTLISTAECGVSRVTQEEADKVSKRVRVAESLVMVCLDVVSGTDF